MPVLIMMNKSYCDTDAMGGVVNYICRAGYGYCGGYAVDPRYAAEQMGLVKRLWGKEHGRQIRHFILSFDQEESIRYEQAMQIGFDICRYYSSYQSIYGLHGDTKHLHLHFAINTVSYLNGKMYAKGVSDWYALKDYIQGLMPQWYVDLRISDGKMYAGQIFENLHSLEGRK